MKKRRKIWKHGLHILEKKEFGDCPSKQTPKRYVVTQKEHIELVR
jgi:hypothetical protein